MDSHLGELNGALLAQAVRIYLARAYCDAPIPENRRHFVDVPDWAPLDTWLKLKGTERLTGLAGDGQGGYAFRVGNAWYPHMKITIRPYGRPPGFVFGVDTHDEVPMPENDAEARALRQLKSRNQELARAVEAEWEGSGLPTSNGVLRKAVADLRADRAL